MKLIYRAPAAISSLYAYDGMPVELAGPIMSEVSPGEAGLVAVYFPNGVTMDVFTDELYIKE